MNTLFYIFIAGTVVTLVWATFLFFYWEIPRTVSEFRSFSQMLKERDPATTRKTKRTLIKKRKQKERESYEIAPRTGGLERHKDPKETNAHNKDNNPGMAFCTPAEGGATEYLPEISKTEVTEFLKGQDHQDDVVKKRTEYLTEHEHQENTEFLSAHEPRRDSALTESQKAKNQGIVTELLDIEENDRDAMEKEWPGPKYTQILTEMTVIDHKETKEKAMEGIKKT